MLMSVFYIIFVFLSFVSLGFKNFSSYLVWFVAYFLLMTTSWALCLSLLPRVGELFSNSVTSWVMGYDTFSLFFILLTLVVVLFSMLSMLLGLPLTSGSWSYSRVTEMLMCYSFLNLFLVVMFTAVSGMLFFVSFECCVLPIFMLIVYWGSQQERVLSTYYFLFYSLIAPLPFLFMILLSVSHSVGTFFYVKMNSYWLGLFTESFGTLEVLGLMFGFLIKLPLFSFHQWLPKAHVDAPVSGSMVLASVLLKMGSYSVVRLASFDWFLNNFIISWVLVLGVWGFFLSAIVCLRLTDYKVIVAFSSVSHMSIATAGLLTGCYWGVLSSFYVFLSHGFISPLLFYLGTLIYQQSGSRLMTSSSGVYSMGSLFYFTFLFTFMMNFSFPPFLNFFGELGVFYSLYNFNIMLSPMVFLGFLFSGIYMMVVVVSMSHHRSSSYCSFSMKSCTYLEWIIAWFLLIIYLILSACVCYLFV